MEWATSFIASPSTMWRSSFDTYYLDDTINLITLWLKGIGKITSHSFNLLNCIALFLEQWHKSAQTLNCTIVFIDTIIALSIFSLHIYMGGGELGAKVKDCNGMMLVFLSWSWEFLKIEQGWLTHGPGNLARVKPTYRKLCWKKAWHVAPLPWRSQLLSSPSPVSPSPS